MLKRNRHIEIVRSSTKGLSSMSQVSCDAVSAVLGKHFTRVTITAINTLADLEALVLRRPDLVFLGMKFVPADPAIGFADSSKIWLSDFLDSHGIAYTGSVQAAHELERNKPLAKQRVLNAGLKTPAFCVINQQQIIETTDMTLAYPVFIKPTNQGGGLGIDSASIAHNIEQLAAKAQTITHGLRTDALVEEYLPGREFSVAILKDEYSAHYRVMPIELVAPADKDGERLLGSSVKSANAEQVLAVRDHVVRDQVSELALDVFYALGARDYGRIDIRLSADGTAHFLEANLIPSLISGYGSFPKACALNSGMEYEPMIMRIAQLGLARHATHTEVMRTPSGIAASVFPVIGAYETA